MTWKQRILLWLNAIAGICTIIGGLDLTEILPLVPNQIAAILTLALPVVITVGKIATIIGDLLDDGLRNDSFKGGTWILLLVLILGCQFVTGCTVVTSKVTSPDGTVTETTTKAVDPASVQAIAATAAAYAPPRAFEIHTSGK